MKGGWRADEEEVTRIAKELLNILEYLSSRRPAVTHRLALREHAMYLMLEAFHHGRTPRFEVSAPEIAILRIVFKHAVVHI